MKKKTEIHVTLTKWNENEKRYQKKKETKKSYDV